LPAAGDEQSLARGRMALETSERDEEDKGIFVFACGSKLIEGKL
jgi:hypothetical protein